MKALHGTTSSSHKAQATLKLKLHLSTQTQNAGLHTHNTVQRQNNNMYLWWQCHISTVIPRERWHEELFIMPAFVFPYMDQSRSAVLPLCLCKASLAKGKNSPCKNSLLWDTQGKSSPCQRRMMGENNRFTYFVIFL